MEDHAGEKLQDLKPDTGGRLRPMQTVNNPVFPVPVSSAGIQKIDALFMA
jgi:hypothetical protein